VPPEPWHASLALAALAFLAFFISFATILIIWISHHALFKLIDKSDMLFLFANGFLLLLVTTVPFPTQLVAMYLTTPVAGVACTSTVES
jgi:uncharacterized membrane protein